MVSLTPVTSSNIKAIGHDATKDELHVDFGNGVYVYAGVPASAHAALIGAESVGKHFHQHIKGKFDHRKPGDDNDRAR